MSFGSGTVGASSDWLLHGPTSSTLCPGEARGEDALALGEDLKNQREEMYTLGQQLRREARVSRKPPLPNFRQDHSYTRELEHQV